MLRSLQWQSYSYGKTMGKVEFSCRWGGKIESMLSVNYQGDLPVSSQTQAIDALGFIS